MKTILNNFIPINRNIFKHVFWTEKRVFSKFEAWLDLIATARYDVKPVKMILDNQLVSWQRGELVASLRYLGLRWGWSRSKVNYFIKLLCSEGMIKTRTACGAIQTIVTICNYDTYNAISESSESNIRQPEDNPVTTEGQPKDNLVTTEGQPRDKTNKENKNNKDEKNKEREIYRGFAHLRLFSHQYLKLIEAGFSQPEIDKILDDIENYTHNTKYSSLYLTAKKWLEKEKKQVAAAADKQAYTATPHSAKSNRIGTIANAFEEALQHG